MLRLKLYTELKYFLGLALQAKQNDHKLLNKVFIKKEVF